MDQRPIPIDVSHNIRLMKDIAKFAIMKIMNFQDHSLIETNSFRLVNTKFSVKDMAEEVNEILEPMASKRQVKVKLGLLESTNGLD